jgi:hypothetical protein
MIRAGILAALAAQPWALEAAALEATPSDQSALAECLSILLRVL